LQTQAFQKNVTEFNQWKKKMKASKAVKYREDDRSDPQDDFMDRAWTTEFSGVGFGYIMRVDQKHEWLPCIYSLQHFTEPHYQVRAYRQDRRLRGKNVRPLPNNALRDELVVLPGAGMTAEEVVATLRNLINSIETVGLAIGKAKDDDFTWRKSDSRTELLPRVERDGSSRGCRFTF